MGWHKELQVTAYVDGDEGSIYLDSPELFEYFHKHPKGHGFSLCISEGPHPRSKRYWINSEGRNDFS